MQLVLIVWQGQAALDCWSNSWNAVTSFLGGQLAQFLVRALQPDSTIGPKCYYQNAEYDLEAVELCSWPYQHLAPKVSSLLQEACRRCSLCRKLGFHQGEF